MSRSCCYRRREIETERKGGESTLVEERSEGTLALLALLVMMKAKEKEKEKEKEKDKKWAVMVD